MVDIVAIWQRFTIESYLPLSAFGCRPKKTAKKAGKAKQFHYNVQDYEIRTD
jgi:hypothetical protein